LTGSAPDSLCGEKLLTELLGDLGTERGIVGELDERLTAPSSAPDLPGAEA
jgi:hypothetical protein